MSNEHALDQVRIRVLPDGRVNRRDSAAYLGVSPKTMAMWQTQGRGPATVLVGGRRFSYIEELGRYVVEGDAGADGEDVEPGPGPQLVVEEVDPKPVDWKVAAAAVTEPAGAA